MKLKLTLICTALLTADISVLAQTTNQTTIGVLNIAGPRRTLANNLAALLEANLSTDSRFAVVARSELNKVLDEQSLGKAGILSPDTAAKIGQMTGAQILVTGREFGAGSRDDIVVVASVIGTETGRVFSKTAQGSATNLMALATNLSDKIKQTIAEQSTNLLAAASDSTEQRLDNVIQEIKDKPKPAVSVQINESASGQSSHGAQSELGQIFQKAGFAVVDDKSEQRPEILVTGDAMAAAGPSSGNLFSGHATLTIKAQERTTGNILALDLQQGVAVDTAKQMAVELALKNAADRLCERLLPTLAKQSQ